MRVVIECAPSDPSRILRIRRQLIVHAGMARRQYETDPAYARRASVVIPLGEMGTAEQVAQATAFLCSPEAAYMTGSVLLVDGGASLFQFGE